MAPSMSASPPAPRTPEDARARLFQAGLQLFAQQGYSKTSTRELAEAAQVNVAAISYYFGDKAGLYRAVFFEPNGGIDTDNAHFSGAHLTLPQALEAFFASFLEPLRQGDAARLCMKLHLREMLEPTGLWEEEVNRGIKPMHEALIGVLCRHLGLTKPDDEVRRLAVCLAGLGVHLHVGRDVIDALAPALNRTPRAVDVWSERLVMFGLAMVEAEQARRGHATKPAPPVATKRTPPRSRPPR
jgi:TetR/AcrR family transcriptional regulator, regulator of cefoperazone and chloramphenicol sensitivity